jgi:dolichol-phosphate mannosyltransferase
VLAAMTPDPSILGDDPAAKRTLIIVPIYDEKANIPELAQEIFTPLTDVHLLDVNDNSPGGMADLLEEFGRKYPNLQVLRRSGERGLGRFIPIACQ